MGKKKMSRLQRRVYEDPWTNDTKFGPRTYEGHYKDLGGGRGVVLSLNK